MKISGVTPDVFKQLRNRLVFQNQAEVTGSTQGTITGHGVTAAYRYDQQTQSLVVDVTRHPFFVPVSAIEAQLRQAVAASSSTK